MRNQNGQFIKGHTGNPLGRPKRADEQILVDLWDSMGRAQFTAAIERGEPWALKTLMDKLYPNQKATTYEVSSTPQPILVRFAWGSSEEEQEKYLELSKDNVN